MPLPPACRHVRTAAAVLAVPLVLLGAAACHKAAPKAAAAAAAPAPLTVSVAPVRTMDLKGGITASGLIVPRMEAAVTSELSGYRVAQVFVDQDQSVKAGQPLARLDDTLLRAQIAQAQAQVDAQKIAAERSRAEASRVAGLDNQGVLPEEQILERRLASRSAGANVEAAQAQLNDLLTRERLMTIRAPVSGLVLERTVRPGDISSPTAVMYRIAEDGVTELNAEAPEADLQTIHPGDRAEVTLPDGAVVPGVVRVVSPEVDSTTKLGHVRITLPVRSDLRPGGYARAVFTGSGRQVTAVPESAIRFDADGASVMVLGPGDRAVRVPVKTGDRVGGLVEIVQGPKPGETVLLGGGVFVLDGDHVRPVRADAPQV